MCESHKVLTALTIAMLMVHQTCGRQQHFLREPTDVTAIAGQQVRKSFNYGLELENEGCAALHSGGQGRAATVDQG